MLTKEELVGKISPILGKNNVKRAAFFGSYARGDYTEFSDVDIVIDKGDSPLKFLKFLIDLEDSVGKSFDVLTLNQLNSVEDLDIHGRFRGKVQDELEWFYGV